MSETDPRQLYMRAILSMEGVPYVWGGKYPHPGLDCSGLVTLGLYLAGGCDTRRTVNTDTMWSTWQKVLEGDAKPGDLCIYGYNPDNPWDVAHVMTLMEDGRVYGACGGDRSTITPELARRRSAKVQYRAEVRYRPDFRGYVKLPF